MAYSNEYYQKVTKPWQEKNKDRLKVWRKDADLKKKYGITLTDYNVLLVNQKGVCAICGKPETQVHHKSGLPYSLSVDHCHKTGKVRELLCNWCNKALGLLQDDLEYMKKLESYLKKYTV